MEELVSGIYYKQDGYKVELFHKIPGVQEPEIIGTINLKRNEHEKIDDGRTTVGKYFKNTHVCENQDLLMRNLKKSLYKLKMKEEKKKTEKIYIVIPNEEITTWEQLKGVVNKVVFNREKEFKIILATIISKWFQKNTSIYLVLIGVPGCGKTTITDCFDGNEFTLHNDEITMQSFIPGTTDASQKPSAFLKLISEKTLITQDLSGILGTDERLIRRFIRFLTAVYGRKKYRKHSPGTGLMTLPADFNFIKKLVISTIYKLDALKSFAKDKDIDKFKSALKDKWDILTHNLISFGITDEHLDLDDEYRALLISL